MNEFIKAATLRYPEELNKLLIHPINKVDGEIIVELGEILKKLNATDVKAILDSYKYQKDSEIYDKLLQWNIDHPIKVDEKVDEKSGSRSSVLFRRNFIFFNDLRLDVFFIHCWEKSDHFNFVKGEMEYEIVVNKLSDSTSPVNSTSHKVIRYSSADIRDRDFERLDSFMQNFEGINFVNEK